MVDRFTERYNTLFSPLHLPVSPFYDDRRGYMIVIPKPIINFLGEPKSLKFIIKGKNVQVIADNKWSLFRFEEIIYNILNDIMSIFFSFFQFF